MTRALTLARAFFVRDLVTDASYKVSVLIEVIDVLIGVAAFFYLSRVIGDRQPGGYDAFAFILVGIAINNAMSTALSSFSMSIQTDQHTGTLKPVLASPLAPAAVVLLGSVYPMARSAASALAYLIAGVLLFGMPAGATNLPAAAVVLVASLMTFGAIGVLSAVFTLAWKRGDPIVWLFSAVSWLLSGVFFPVASLPAPLQWLSSFLPLTYALDAMRATLLAGAGLADVSFELVVLSACALVGLPISLSLVGTAVAWGRRTGSLGHS
jgi:ABC-2 type transport system permease protein